MFTLTKWVQNQIILRDFYFYVKLSWSRRDCKEIVFCERSNSKNVTKVSLYLKDTTFWENGIIMIKNEDNWIPNVLKRYCQRYNFDCNAKVFLFLFSLLFCFINFKENRGRRGRDRMVVGFTTTYAINAYHHWCCELETWSGRGVQHYMIKFVCDLRQVDGFLRVLRFPPPIKLNPTI